MTIEQSTSQIVSVINKLTTADNGKFLQYDGTSLPW